MRWLSAPVIILKILFWTVCIKLYINTFAQQHSSIPQQVWTSLSTAVYISRLLFSDIISLSLWINSFSWFQCWRFIYDRVSQLSKGIIKCLTLSWIDITALSILKYDCNFPICELNVSRFILVYAYFHFMFEPVMCFVQRCLRITFSTPELCYTKVRPYRPYTFSVTRKLVVHWRSVSTLNSLYLGKEKMFIPYLKMPGLDIRVY